MFFNKAKKVAVAEKKPEVKAAEEIPLTPLDSGEEIYDEPADDKEIKDAVNDLDESPGNEEEKEQSQPMGTDEEIDDEIVELKAKIAAKEASIKAKKEAEEKAKLQSQPIEQPMNDLDTILNDFNNRLIKIEAALYRLGV